MRPYWLLERLSRCPDQVALVWRDRSFTYQWLGDKVAHWSELLPQLGVHAGQVIALDADYSPEVCALLLALLDTGAVIVPLTSATTQQKAEFLEIAEAGGVFSFNSQDLWHFTPLSRSATHPLLLEIKDRGSAGLILFSSGSTGAPKAAVHDFHGLLEKFKTNRRAYVTLAFLLLDHIGGINTLFHTLANCGTAVSMERRDPAAVCRAVELYKVELLPTSPTFLNLLIISEEFKHYDLSSLQVITYGTEVMPATTLKRLNEIFPQVRLQQTYGLSEVGILRSKSLDSRSLWVKVGGEGYDTKVVDGVLWIRAQSAMLGYLNAPSPFDAEGWLNTGDAVEVDGEYLRILGRHSEIINVGGQKVYPGEVESVLLQMDNVMDAVVYGEKNPLIGNLVVARLNCLTPEDPMELKRRIREFCRDKLEPFKIPVKLETVETQQFNSRFKHIRR